MLFYNLDYAIFAALGFLVYKLWDRGQSNQVTELIRNPDWLTSGGKKPQPSEAATAQQLYDFSGQYIDTLKGVLAAPTPPKLARLSEVLASPYNLHDQL
jgi:hypothetical protein